MTDILLLALQTDSTRVVTFMFGNSVSNKNFSFVAAPFGEFTAPEKFDLFWITQNYHDLKIAKYGVVDLAVFNRAVFDALNRPVASVDPLGHRTSAVFDAAPVTVFDVRRAPAALRYRSR